MVLTVRNSLNGDDGIRVPQPIYRMKPFLRGDGTDTLQLMGDAVSALTNVVLSGLETLIGTAGSETVPTSRIR